jgi:hypothetical protein
LKSEEDSNQNLLQERFLFSLSRRCFLLSLFFSNISFIDHLDSFLRQVSQYSCPLIKGLKVTLHILQFIFLPIYFSHIANIPQTQKTVLKFLALQPANTQPTTVNSQKKKKTIKKRKRSIKQVLSKVKKKMQVCL